MYRYFLLPALIFKQFRGKQVALNPIIPTPFLKKYRQFCCTCKHRKYELFYSKLRAKFNEANLNIWKPEEVA